MYNYEQKMNELGLEKAKLSKGLKQELREFELAAKEYSTLMEQISDMDESNENYENINNEINEYRELLTNTDGDLTNKIQRYYDKKDYYAAKMEHMKQKTAEKRGGAPATTQSPTSGNFQILGTTSGTTAVGVDITNYPINPEPVINNLQSPAQAAPEKKSDSGSWLLWGGLAVLGLIVGVNVMKNRE
jgi:hypothetical protein